MAKSPEDAVMIRGAPYYGLKRAQEIIAGVSLPTLHRWAEKGWTSFGYPIDSVRYRGELYLPQKKVLILKGHLEDFPLPKPTTPEEERLTFRVRARMLVECAPAPNSRISMRNRPRPKDYMP